MTETGFKKYQYEFTAHLRDPEHNPAPEGIEDRRIGIYRDLLYNNVEGFIANGFPVLRSIYSDENWHRMLLILYHQERTNGGRQVAFDVVPSSTSSKLKSKSLLPFD